MAVFRSADEGVYIIHGRLTVAKRDRAQENHSQNGKSNVLFIHKLHGCILFLKKPQAEQRNHLQFGSEESLGIGRHYRVRRRSWVRNPRSGDIGRLQEQTLPPDDIKVA